MCLCFGLSERLYILKHTDHTDYYVYLHRRKDNDAIFYVGKGRKNRALRDVNRNAGWHDVVEESGGFIVEYVYNSLTESESHLLELEQYHKYKNTLVNVKVPGNETLDYSSINWSDIMMYDPESPTYLTWKIPNGSRNPNTRRNVGDPVSCFRKVKGKLKHGQLHYKGNHYALHRIVWVIVNGPIPKGLVVNHIDNNPTNNLISNLELCSMSENSKRY